MSFEPSKLSTARSEKGMKPEVLAYKAGVTRQTIDNYERGKTSPPADVLSKIALALDKPINFFFSNNNNEIISDSDSTGVSAGKSGAGSCEEDQSRAATASYPGKCSTGRI